MLYSVLIYETPGVSDARPSEERQRVLEIHRRLQAETREDGRFVAATQLAEAGALTLKRPGQTTLISDGPFPETKELFIGFYLFECAHLEEAIALAERVASTHVTVEVRPVVWSETRAFTPG